MVAGMTDPRAWLDALDAPAAVLGAGGAVLRANAAFTALPEAERAAAGADPSWRRAPMAGGETLVTVPDRRLAQRDRMLATLSHEVRTPLNGVLGMAGLLARTRLDADQAAYLQALRESGEHLLSLVEDVLDFAKLDGGRLELEPADTDLEHLVQTVCELLSPRARAGGIEIAWAVEGPPPPRVLADDGRLRQILFNLAGNAVKLTTAGGVLLTVSGARRGPGRARVRFTVRDTGPGLDAAAAARIWGEFEQTEAGARAGGAGLGLAIVRRLADAFGGRLGLDSAPGQGARFWFETDLPTAPGARTSRPAAALAGVAVALDTPSAPVRAAAALQLTAAGAGVPAGDTATSPDIRLIDAAERSPGPPPPGVPALLLLAPEERDRIGPARADGWAGYLIKPLRPASLAARIRAALGAEANAVPTRSVRAPPPEDERAAATAAEGARVLLAEDNPVNAMLARALLQREGCAVERAATGEEAVEAARRAPFDLILMDLRMPGLGGLEATAALRAAGVRAPVVALTANAFADDRRACLEAGMDDFLTKPLDPAALRAVLGRWTRRRTPPADAAAA